MNQQELKDRLIHFLQQGDSIQLKWDCGGDEALIYIHRNGQPISYEEPWAAAFELYIFNKLSLPSAGEFSMEGKGTLLYKAGALFLDCASYWKGYADEDDWKEVNDYEEDYSGVMELFT